jgi:hypothetical protein
MIKELQLWLWFFAARFGDQTGLDAAPQHHDTPRATPTRQPEFGFHGVKALAYTLPLASPPEPLDQTLDPRRLLELEEIGLPRLFHLGHHAFIAEGDVAAYQDGTLLRSELFEQLA